MTDAQVKALLRTANSIAKNFSISGYTQSDLAQECVIKVWMELGDDYDPKHWKLIRTIMFHHLIDKVRMAQCRPDRPGKIPYGFSGPGDQEVFEFSEEEPPNIPIPESSEKVKRVTLAVIHQKGCITDAAKELGWGYMTTWRAWQKAKKEIRKEVNNG